MIYQIVIKDNSGNKIGDIQDFDELKWTHVLNREGDCSFTLPLKSENTKIQMMDLRRSNVEIYEDGVIQWGGFIHSISTKITYGDDILTVFCKGYLALLKTRICVSATYTATDAGAIAWGLINTSQSQTYGDMGITSGTIQTSVQRDRTYQYKNIYDALIDLSEVINGYDIMIDTQKRLQIYYPQKGTIKTDTIIFRHGENISTTDYSEDFIDGVNRAIVLGSGFGSAMSTATVDNTTLQSQYYLMEGIVNQKSIEGTTSLQAHGEDEILKKGVARREYIITQIPGTYPTLNDIETGDWIRLSVDYGRVQIEDVVRVKMIEISVEAGVKTVKYTFMYY